MQACILAGGGNFEQLLDKDLNRDFDSPKKSLISATAKIEIYPLFGYKFRGLLADPVDACSIFEKRLL